MYKGYSVNGAFNDVSFSKKGKTEICDAYICLDTETSHNNDADSPKCWIYQWCFSFNGSLYVGRTPEQLCIYLQNISQHYELNEKRKMYVFVHNLPYDFSYLLLYFNECFGEPTNILAYAAHKVFNIVYENGLEFRCSYKLSNDSLDRWSKKLQTKHQKLVGTIDYEQVRYQNSKLTKRDWKYMLYDVIVLDECIQKQLEIYGDSKVIDLPYTSTGYTRREILTTFKGKRTRYVNRNVRNFRERRLFLTSYLLHNDEFSGGISQGNRMYKGVTVKGTIKHRDFRSHYPSQLRVNRVPITKPVQFTNRTTIEYLTKKKDRYCIIVDIVLKNAKLKSRDITLPYMQKSHILRKTSKDFRYLDDNGRIIEFKGASHTSLYLDELLLLRKQYDFEYVILKSYASKWGYIPEYLKDVIDKHYKAKSDLKALEKKLEKEGAPREEIYNAHINLLKSKNIINGIYGVYATNPIRTELKLDGNKWSTVYADEDTISDKLDKYYHSYNKFSEFQWGCICTLYARMELMEFVELIGYDNFLYSDTDSIFYVSTPEIEERIEKRNKEMYEHAISIGAYIKTDAGDVITYNSFDDEEEEIIEFKFLHSKCYAYVTSDGKLHSTIAGVVKKCGKVFEEDELGTIENLKDGFVFNVCGGTKAKYVEEEIHDYKGNSTCGGCIITKTTKTLNEDDFDEREGIYYQDEY